MGEKNGYGFNRITPGGNYVAGRQIFRGKKRLNISGSLKEKVYGKYIQKTANRRCDNSRSNT